MKSDWHKCPSVHREGKWFYVKLVDGGRYSIRQNWETGLWHLNWLAKQMTYDEEESLGSFRTWKLAANWLEENR